MPKCDFNKVAKQLWVAASGNFTLQKGDLDSFYASYCNHCVNDLSNFQ